MAPLYLRPLSRRQLLGGFAAMTASSVLSGCGASLTRAMSSTISTQPPPTQPAPTQPTPTPPTPPQPPPTPPQITPQPTPTGVITAASMTISSTIVGDLGTGFVGLAYEKQSLLTPLFTAANTGLIALFQMLGPSVLRLGGVSVDESVWTPQSSGQTAGQIAPADIDSLAAFLRATGWTCIYGINLGGSATGATTPALAAAEAAYVSQRLGPALAGIELGNACETYGDPGSYYAGNWSVEIFESLWQQYRAAIVAATPSAPIAGPAAASGIDSWTLPFGEYVTSSELDLLTQHYTRGPASTATIDGLISADPALTTDLLQLHYGAQSIGVPFRIDACSAYSDGGAPGVSDAYASSLWAIDTVFNAGLGGASGLNFQTGGQQPCTPIADNAGVILGAQPIFYGLLLAATAGQGTLLATQLSAGALNVTAYALQASDGSMSIVVVNKDATQSLNLSIALPQSMTAATVQQMTQLSTGATAPSLSALSGVMLQGATIAADGAFQPAAPYSLTLNGAQLSCYAPALSAVLLQLS